MSILSFIHYQHDKNGDLSTSLKYALQAYKFDDKDETINSLLFLIYKTLNNEEKTLFHGIKCNNGLNCNVFQKTITENFEELFALREEVKNLREVNKLRQYDIGNTLFEMMKKYV